MSLSRTSHALIASLTALACHHNDAHSPQTANVHREPDPPIRSEAPAAATPDQSAARATSDVPKELGPDGFWLVADTQLHNSTASDALVRSGRLDRYAPAAIRPPSTDLWTGMMFYEALEEMKARASSEPMFFLGDAADISCASEYEYFLRILRDANNGQLPWLAVLGNHDGYYEGNITRQPDLPLQASGDPFVGPRRSNRWSEACYTTPASLPQDARLVEFERETLIKGKNTYATHFHQRSLAKASSTLLYLSSLHQRHLVFPDPLARDSWLPVANDLRPGEVITYESRGEVLFGDGLHALHVIAQLASPPERGNDDNQWRAHVVQDLQLRPGFHVLLIDTSDPVSMPLSDPRRSIPSAIRQLLGCRFAARVAMLGLCGQFSEEQRLEIEHMMKDWEPGARFVVLGHHNLDSFGKTAGNELRRVLERPGLVGYFSAHTHYAASRAEAFHTGRWEVNIGSLTDAPLRYAHVTYRPTDDQITIELLRPATKPCFYGETDARGLDPRKELAYRALEKYLARAVWAYTQLFDWLERHESWSPQEAAQVAPVSQIVHELAGEVQANPPDTAVIREKLARVIEFDRSTLQRRPEVREVERSCAAWASESEGASDKKIANGVHLDPTEPGTILPVNAR
jgi:calcineurin-like phosphoesterase family protein